MSAAKLLIEGTPDHDEIERAARFFGGSYTRPDDTLGIWPENWLPVQVFTDLMTQWNVGPGGVIGLRYEALGLVLDLHGIEARQRRDVFHAIRVLENEAVSRMNASK